jgi:hypothetical protein
MKTWGWSLAAAAAGAQTPAKFGQFGRFAKTEQSNGRDREVKNSAKSGCGSLYLVKMKEIANAEEFNTASPAIFRLQKGRGMWLLE